MHEMLGNQHFMARRYDEAAKELEICYKLNPANKSIKKKLIVCYTQIGKVKLAFELFLDLVTEDIEFIIKTDPLVDDCPCFELVEKNLFIDKFNLNSTDILTVKGIIWLYCDYEKSLSMFKELDEKLNSNKVKKIIKLINDYKQTLISIKQ
jgi:tetratricopeptide (TPR) repeat protein